MVILEPKKNRRLGLPRFMEVFHVSFLLLGIVSLFLIVVKVIALDLSAVFVIVLTILFNAFFAIMWASEASRGRVKVNKQTLPAKILHLHPMVSFIVPFFNQEHDVSRSLNALFKCATEYRGPSEVIIVDDGSTDSTYEAAWLAVQSKRHESVDVKVKIIKHLTNLGKPEAIRTGVNKAMGEYIALTDSHGVCDSRQLSDLVDHVTSEGISKAVADTIQLYRSDSLRSMLSSETSRPNAATA